MRLEALDVVVFVAFLALVVAVSLYASREEEDTEDYFLAGRRLSWWLIGFSLIASNISTEQFVGMAGSGYGSTGLAVASYEWIAAISLVVVAWLLLPRFLSAGIYTMPEFLEYRFGPRPRAIMAAFMMIMYVVVALPSILYSGAVTLHQMFPQVSLEAGVWAIGIIAGGYTVYGGLKAVVWSDLLQGGALLLGGALVMVLGFQAVGGVDAFFSHNADKLHVVLPASDPAIPWTALLFGIWIPNFFYWGLNQFITQRTLGARSLAAGQNGIMLAATLKLVTPFLVVFPGIMAFQLYGSELGPKMDQAYPMLITRILPAGLTGVVFAALFGAVMSTLDSLLNSASTILTMDLYRRHLRPDATPRQLVGIGRWTTAVFVIAGCAVAPQIAHMSKGVFDYIQKFQGFVSPGILAVFVFGMVVPRAPTVAAVTGLLLNIPVYGLLLWLWPALPFLQAMAIVFLCVVIAMAILTWLQPLAAPVTLPRQTDFDLTSSRVGRWWGTAIIAATVALYVVFW